jgi:hypothetical protein
MQVESYQETNLIYMVETNKATKWHATSNDDGLINTVG